MRNTSDKSCRETQNIHFVFSNFFFWKTCRLWDNVENVCRAGQASDKDMCIACWIPKATNTHSGCIIIIAFPLQQWLHEHASMLRYNYTACLVKNNCVLVRNLIHKRLVGFCIKTLLSLVPASTWMVWKVLGLDHRWQHYRKDFFFEVVTSLISIHV